MKNNIKKNVKNNVKKNINNRVYYKITTKDLKSCTTTDKDYRLPDKYKVQYKLNEEVIGPDNTPLFVFDSLDKARSFAYYKIRNSSEARIFECKVTKPRKIKYMSYLDILDIFLLFMRNKQMKKSISKNHGVFSPPTGTWAVSSVKLLKEVT